MKPQLELSLFRNIISNYIGPVVNLVISLVCPSAQTQISVTAGRNILILGMMMGYGLGMIPDIFVIWSGIPDAQTKMSVSEKRSIVKRYTGGCTASVRLCSFHPCCPLYGARLRTRVKRVNLRNALFLY